MSASYRALIIPDQLNQPVRLGPLEPNPENLRRLVGGDVESVVRGDWHVYFNSFGWINSLPSNLRASQLMHESGLDLGDVVRGTAVFLGHGLHGAEADVPDYLVRRDIAMFGAPLAA